MKRLLFIIICLVTIITVSTAGVLWYNYKYRKVIITPIGKEVYFTREYNSSAKTCVPAAYSSESGEIVGAYRINGKTYQKKQHIHKASLTKSGLVISKKWQSENGFEQHTLVNKGRPYPFSKDPNRRLRRALCCKNEDRHEYYIIESTYPMTMSEFAIECSKNVYYAINLDMGTYSFGRVNGKIRCWWTLFWRNQQTNWICTKD